MNATVLLVMLMSAVSANAGAPLAATDVCTEPLLSYTYDSSEAGDYSSVTCLVCADATTWRLVNANGEKRVVTRAIVDISHLASAVEQVPLGNVVEALDAGNDSPTIFYWAHPSRGPKFLLKARQLDRLWTNDSMYTPALVDAIDSICGGQL